MMARWWVLCWTVCSTTALAAAESSPEAIEFFEKRVRPVLVEHCSECHSENDPSGGLRLDSRAFLMRGGESGPAVVAGKPEESLLIEAVTYDPDGYQMPPTGKLPEDAIAALTEWVKQGAVWPGSDEQVAAADKGFDLEARMQHWSFQPLRVTAPPEVQRSDWPRNAIDRFILARLDAEGLSPSAAADPRTLARRVALELTGLPPAPAGVQAFVDDQRPDAWSRWVEQQLASPHYGERWGRHWLDLVRFAETCGHEFDYEIPYAWPYRDYVIRALNADVPYDEFVREHIAGDLLQTPRRDSTNGGNESVIGTAFYWFSQGKHSPVDIRSEECDTVDNQVDVFGKTFLGLTIACSRCHDHKFDPIPQRDYYALAGFLQSSRRAVVDTSAPETTQSVVASLTALDREHLPTALRSTAERTSQFAQRLAERLLSDDPQDIAWRTEAAAAAQQDRTHPLHAWFQWSQQSDLPQRIDAALVESAVTGEAAQERVAILSPPEQDTDASGQPVSPWFREDAAFHREQASGWLCGESSDRPLRGYASPLSWAHSGTVSRSLRGVLRTPTFTVTTPFLDFWMHRRGGADKVPRQNKVGHVHLIVDGFQLIRNPLYGQLTIDVQRSDRPRWYRQDVRGFLGSRVYLEFEDLDDGELIVERVEGATGHPAPAPVNGFLLRQFHRDQVQTREQLAQSYQRSCERLAESLRAAAAGSQSDWTFRDSEGAAELLNWLIEQAPAASALNDSLAAALQNRKAIESRLPHPQWSVAMTDGTAEDEHLLIRGNYRKPGEPVRRQFLAALKPSVDGEVLGPDAGEAGSGRLALADCVVHAENPLTARVMVNRIWQHHFGRGLVPTPDDFGKMGQPPSHPELLDWLAAEFICSGWSVKHMHRLILESATYRQTSRPSDPVAEERDPQNVWLHRMNVQRLEAEPVRDSLLVLSGRLDDRMFGPSVLPHLTPFMEGRGRPSSGPLDGDGRRSLYINVRRNFLSPLFLAFDFPTPFTTMGRRSSSNVPAQALTLMNNPLVLQQTARWAERGLQTSNDPAQRVNQLYEEAFGRPPTSDEQATALSFIESAEADADAAQAWRDLAHVLVNVKEFVFIE